MLDWVIKYWLEVLFSGILFILTTSVKLLFSRLKKDQLEKQKKAEKESREQKLIKEGVLAILHDRLYQACKYYLEQEWCSVEDMNNLTCMYTGYHALGGNSICTELYNRVCKLPLEPPKEGSE